MSLGMYLAIGFVVGGIFAYKGLLIQPLDAVEPYIIGMAWYIVACLWPLAVLIGICHFLGWYANGLREANDNGENLSAERILAEILRDMDNR